MAETAHAGPYGGPASSGGSGGDAGVKEQAQDKAQEVKEQARQQAQQAAGQAKGRISGEVDRRSTHAGEQVSQQASDLRAVGEKLRGEGKEGPAKVADQVADRAERIGGYLTRSDGDTILQDVEDVARRQPWAVMAGGLALGFLASRILKASSSERYERRSAATTGPSYGTPALPESSGSGYGSGAGAGVGSGEGRFVRPADGLS